MKCAYCGNNAKGTKEHIISCSILDLFPECYLTIDDSRNKIYEADPMIKDVCADCNNKRISYIDSYAKKFISQYFIQKYTEENIVEIEYNYTMIQKMLLKYAYNDMRSHKYDCSFFDEEILYYRMNESDSNPKENVSILCGLAINVSPLPDIITGNRKLCWCKDPFFCSNSTIKYIDYKTGQIFINENVQEQEFPDLKLSYLFRFNSVQFLLMCWDKNSANISQNNTILKFQYPYYFMNADDYKAIIPVCTNEINYHKCNIIHVSWDLISEVGLIRKHASGGKYEYKKFIEMQWAKEEERIKNEHPRN